MGQIFPTFDVQPSKIYNKIEGLLEAAKKEFNDCLLVENPTWTTMDKFDELRDELSRYLSEISHLKNVLNDSELIEAYHSCIPMITNFGAYISQNEDYYKFLNKIDQSKLNTIQKRLLEKAIENFKSSGFDLPKKDRIKLTKLSEKLSLLSHKFSENINKDKASWYLNLTKEDLIGLSEQSLERFRKTAKEKGHMGYGLSLVSDYVDVLTSCENRDVRKAMYMGFNRVATKYSNQECDNTPIIENILSLRQEKAELLGFKNYAEYSLRNKMADNPEQVIDFLEDLTQKSRESYKEDIKKVMSLCEEYGIPQEDYQLWDQMFLSKKYQEKKFSIDLSSVQDYFPMEKVLTGLYSFVYDMFGYKIKEIEAPHKYIDDLRLLELSKDGNPVGYIYCDLIARSNKKSGAWMSDYIGKEYGSLPIAFVTCNIPKTSDNLLQLESVVTLFHEFGHALHHTLSDVEEQGCFGISGVPWDAVELPSTFMEFFVLDDSVLPNISAHHETGESLPPEMVSSLKSMKTSLSSLVMMRQMEFSLVDMKAHLNPGDNIRVISDKFRADNGLSELPKDICFYTQFSHIFAGGYAAGYYSYKWANILASDVFESFEKMGGANKDMGRKYLKSILSKGGSKDMVELFVDFKGREPSPDAFLRHNGIGV